MTPELSGRSGFTLMEVLVALLVGGTIIAAGRQLFDVAADAQGRLRLKVEHVAKHRIGIGEIERAVRTGRASESSPFLGTADSVLFEGWCPDSYGGKARCVVRIVAKPSLIITERLGSGDEHAWLADSSMGRFDFVVDGSRSDGTVAGWESASSTPMGIRWVSQAAGAETRDTLLFEILRTTP